MSDFPPYILRRNTILAPVTTSRAEFRAAFAKAMDAYQLAKAADPSIGTLSEWLESLSGSPVQMRVSEGRIEWKLETESEWNELLEIAEISGADGREVEMSANATHIQWRLEGDADWQNLVDLESLAGADALPLLSASNAYYDLSTMLPGDASSVTLLADAAYAVGTPLRFSAGPADYFDAVVTSKSGAYIEFQVTGVIGTHDGSSWQVSVIGVRGDKGDPGSDASVTAANVTTALSGVASSNTVEDTDSVWVTNQAKNSGKWVPWLTGIVEKIKSAFVHLSGGQTIKSSSAGTVTLTLQARSGQTANLLEFKNASGGITGNVTTGGNFVCGIYYVNGQQALTSSGASLQVGPATAWTQIQYGGSGVTNHRFVAGGLSVGTTNTADKINVGGNVATYGNGSGFCLYNLGANYTGNFEMARFMPVSNVFVFQTLKGGTGQDRPIKFSTAACSFFMSPSTGFFGIGTDTPAAKCHVVSTTEQFRAGYDANNYLSITVGSTGGVTFSNAGTATDPSFSFSGNVAVSGTLTQNGNPVATAVSPQRTSITGDGVSTVFPINGAGSLTNPSAVIVAIDGVLQEPTVDYSIGGGNITFTSPVPSGSVAAVIVPMSTVQVVDMIPSDASVTSEKLATDLSLAGQLSLPGQSAANPTSAVTVEIAEALPVSGLQKVFRVIIANAPVSNSGASATVARIGNLTCYFQSSSAAGGYAGIQAGVHFGSAFIDYTNTGWVGVAIPSGALNLPADQVFRVKIEDGAKSITDTLTSKGIAFEAATNGGVRQLRVLGFNTVLTTGDWVNASGVEENWLILATDGAGTVKLWRKNYSTNALTLIAQISGGPVGSAPSTGHRLSLVLLNGTSTTSTQPVYLNAAREILVFGRLNLSTFP